MPVPQIQGSKLICRFMGIVALFVDNGRDRFKVGIIKPKEGSDDIKGHKHEIVIRKAKILDDRELYSKSLRLHDGRHRMTKVKQDDSNVTHQGIELFRPQSGGEGRFNREDVVRSFDWVIDIENELHFDEGGNPAAVSINHSSLRSILEIRDIDHGVLFTGESTQAPIFSVESKDGQGEVFRRYDNAAFVVIAEIALPAEGMKVETQNPTSGEYETVSTLIPAENVFFELIVENTCNKSLSCSSDNNDSVNEAYNDLIKVTPPNRQVFITNDPDQSDATSGCPVIKFKFSDQI